MFLELVDPSKTPCLRAKDAAELIQALAHRFAAVLDNVSTLPEWLSNLLCCAVTGDGFSKRMLYSDDDDVIYTYRRALLFNGISVAITKADLLDRSILIQAERIPDDQRRDEKSLWRQFEEARPKILGAMFDRLSTAIRRNGEVNPSRLPRMADFARWAIAANGNEDQFLTDYAENVERQNSEALNGSVVATVLIDYLSAKSEWSGQAHELYAALSEKAIDLKSTKSFPGSAPALGRKLREIRPNLIALGWKIDFGEKQRPRMITITRNDGENTVGTDGTDVLADSKDSTDSNFRTSSDRMDDDPWDKDLKDDLFD